MSNVEQDNDPERVPVLLSRTSNSYRADDAVDMTVLTGLDEAQVDGEPDLIVELIDLYLKDTPHRIESMQQALTRTDDLTLVRAAHSLKGSSATLGASQMAAMCEELEQTVAAALFQGVVVVLAGLELEFSRVQKAFLAERQKRCR